MSVFGGINMKRRIGYAYMVADIFHIGHLRHLQNAKKHCDYLIVGCLTDSAVIEKKPKPVMTFEERLEILDSIKLIDEVVAQFTYSPLDNVKRIKPDVLMESDSHDEMPANKFVESYGGIVIVTHYWKGQSSTAIKQRVKEDGKKE